METSPETTKFLLMSIGVLAMICIIAIVRRSDMNSRYGYFAALMNAGAATAYLLFMLIAAIADAAFVEKVGDKVYASVVAVYVLVFLATTLVLRSHIDRHRLDRLFDNNHSHG